MKRMTVLFAALLFAVTCFGVSSASAHNGDHRGDRGEKVFGFGRMIHRLDLSKDQENQVASILKSHRTEIGNAVAQLAQARESLANATAAEPFSENAVKDAAKAAADQEAQLMVLRADIMNEIKQILNPDQLKTLQQMRAKRAERMKGRVDRKLADLDEWIAKHSE